MMHRSRARAHKAGRGALACAHNNGRFAGQRGRAAQALCRASDLCGGKAGLLCNVQGSEECALHCIVA